MRTDCHTQDSLFQMKEEVNGVLKAEIIGSRSAYLSVEFLREILRREIVYLPATELFTGWLKSPVDG